MPFEITTDFAQIEQNIIVMDNYHAIEFVILGTKNILKLDNLEFLAMATNKERECKHFLSNILPIIVEEDPYMIHLFGQ